MGVKELVVKVFLAGYTNAIVACYVKKNDHNLLQCNELNRGHLTFFSQSQDEFRTKESVFVHFGPITNEGLTAKNLFQSTKRQLNIY